MEALAGQAGAGNALQGARLALVVELIVEGFLDAGVHFQNCIAQVVAGWVCGCGEEHDQARRIGGGGRSAWSSVSRASLLVEAIAAFVRRDAAGSSFVLLRAAG